MLRSTLLAGIQHSSQRLGHEYNFAGPLRCLKLPRHLVREISPLCNLTTRLFRMPLWHIVHSIDFPARKFQLVHFSVVKVAESIDILCIFSAELLIGAKQWCLLEKIIYHFVVGPTSLCNTKNVIPYIFPWANWYSCSEWAYGLQRCCSKLVLVVRHLTVPPISSQTLFPWLVAKKCLSADNPNSSLCLQRLVKFLKFLYLYAAPSLKYFTWITCGNSISMCWMIDNLLKGIHCHCIVLHAVANNAQGHTVQSITRGIIHCKLVSVSCIFSQENSCIKSWTKKE